MYICTYMYRQYVNTQQLPAQAESSFRPVSPDLSAPDSSQKSADLVVQRSSH